MVFTSRTAFLAILLASPANAGDDAPVYLKSMGEESLRCSACEIVASMIEEKVITSKLIKGWSAWTTEQRVNKLRTTITKKACPPIGDKQIALMGEEGERTFGDFNEMMQKGGTMSNLNMGPEQSKKVFVLCEAVAKSEVSLLVARLETLTTQKKGKKRLADIKMVDEVCKELLGTCKKDDDDDDDDDDDRDEL